MRPVVGSDRQTQGMDVSPPEIRRLAMLRILLDAATRQAEQPPPLSWDAVSRLHDVAEAFLSLILQVVAHKPPPKVFSQFRSDLAEALGREVLYWSRLTQLNSARVEWKHRGNPPNPESCRDFALTVRNLMDDETRNVLGLELTSLSLADMVPNKAVGRWIRLAEIDWEAGESGAAAIHLRAAFETLIDDYLETKAVWGDRTIYDITHQTSSLTRNFRLRSVDPAAANFEEAVSRSLRALNRQITLVGLGIDLRHLGLFMSRTPTVYVNSEGVNAFADAVTPLVVEPEFVACRDFIVTTAWHLYSHDFSTIPGAQP